MDWQKYFNKNWTASLLKISLLVMGTYTFKEPNVKKLKDKLVSFIGLWFKKNVSNDVAKMCHEINIVIVYSSSCHSNS